MLSRYRLLIMGIQYLCKVKAWSIIFLRIYVLAGILFLGCKSPAQNKQEEVSFFDSLSTRLCHCYTSNKTKKFGFEEDTCLVKLLEADSSILKGLGIEQTSTGGRLRIASEVSVRLGKNCPYFIQQNEQFISQIQKEISNVGIKTFRGKITDESPYTNGEYTIRLAAGDSSKSFILSDSIKRSQFDKLANKHNTMLIVQYQTWGPENRIVSIAANR